MAYKWAILNKANYPTMTDFLDACYRADIDDINTRDPRNMMYALMNLEEFNDKVRNCVGIRKTASMICPFSINTIIEPTPDEVEKMHSVKKRLLNAIKTIRETALQTRLYGSMLLEFNWDNLDSENKKRPKLVKKYLPTEIEKIDDSTIRKIIDTNGQITGSELIDISEVTPDNIRYIGAVSNDNFRGGILRTIEYMMIYANDAQKEWHAYNKKLKGVIQAMYPRGSTDPVIEGTKKAAAAVSQHNVLVTGEDIKFAFESLTDSKGSGSFKDFIERFEKSAEFDILGQASTTELPKNGARNAVEIIQQVSANIFQNDMWDIEDLVNILLLQDYQLNYDSSAIVCPWQFTIQVPENIDRVEKIDFVTGLKENGIPTRAKELYEFLGMPMPDKVQDVFFLEPAPNNGLI